MYDIAAKRLIVTVPAALDALSPDGTLLAATNSRDKIQLWNLSSGKAVANLSLPGSAKDTPTTVVFNSDGKSVAIGCTNDTAYVWNLSGV